MEADVSPARSTWSTPWLVVGAAVCAGIGLILLALVVAQYQLLLTLDQSINSPLTEWARSTGWPATGAAIWGNATGPIATTIVALLGIVTLLATRHLRWAILLALSAALGVIVAEALKVTTARQRPPGAEVYAHDLDKSFPSGHSMASVYVYGCIALILFLAARRYQTKGYQAAGLIVAVFALTIGLSRLVLGVHWLSDVIAGWMFGGAVLLLAAAVVHPERSADPRAAVAGVSEPEEPVRPRPS